MQYSIHPFYTWSERIYNIQKIHYPYRMQYRWIKWFYWNSILMISYSKNLVLQDSVLIKGCIYPWIYKKKRFPFLSFHCYISSHKGEPKSLPLNTRPKKWPLNYKIFQYSYQLHFDRTVHLSLSKKKFPFAFILSPYRLPFLLLLKTFSVLKKRKDNLVHLRKGNPHLCQCT